MSQKEDLVGRGGGGTLLPFRSKAVTESQKYPSTEIPQSAATLHTNEEIAVLPGIPGMAAFVASKLLGKKQEDQEGMQKYDPFKPGMSSIDPMLFMGSKASQAPVTEEEKLMEYLKSQMGKPEAQPAAETPVTEPEQASSGAGSGALYMAGAKALGDIGKEIGAQQQFRSKQEQDILKSEGSAKQEAARRQGASKFRSLAELIQNYRSSIR